MRELHYFSICPFSRAIVLLIQEIKIECQLIENNNIYNLISKYHHLNSHFPVLKENINLIDCEVKSILAISEYLIEKYGANYQYLMGGQDLERAKIRQNLWWLFQEFYQNITAVLIYENVLKAFEIDLIDKSPDSFRVRKAQMYLKESLYQIQKNLQKQDFCAGDTISFADFVLAAQISVLDYMNLINWSMDLALLKKWYIVIKCRPNFKLLLNWRVPGFKPSMNYALVDF